MPPRASEPSGTCELAPSGAMRETVTEWVPGRKMVIAIDQIEKLPVKRATMTFTLSGDGDTTPFTMSYDYDPKGGPLGIRTGGSSDDHTADP